MMARTITLMSTALLALCMQAQSTLTGDIHYAQLGISFNIPPDWIGQEGDGLVFIGSERTPGLILMSILELRDMPSLNIELGKGISEDGIELRPVGTVKQTGSSSASMDYEGEIEGQEARGIGHGVLNPYGNGVSLVGLGLKATWSTEFETTVHHIVQSIKFEKVAYSGLPPETWVRNLTNTRLTRMESYSSPSAIEGGAGGGYSSQQRIDLCKGYFSISGSSSVNIDGDGASGSSSGRISGSGTWEVLRGDHGSAVLLLKFQDGRMSEYDLEEQDGKVYLDGQRWYRTWEGEHAPDCR